MDQFSALAASSLGLQFKFSRPWPPLTTHRWPVLFFIAEVMLQSLAIEVLGPLIVSAVVATVVIHHWIGLRPIFTSPSFSIPEQFDLLRPWHRRQSPSRIVRCREHRRYGFFVGS